MADTRDGSTPFVPPSMKEGRFACWIVEDGPNVAGTSFQKHLIAVRRQGDNYSHDLALV